MKRSSSYLEKISPSVDEILAAFPRCYTVSPLITIAELVTAQGLARPRCHSIRVICWRLGGSNCGSHHGQVERSVDCATR